MRAIRYAEERGLADLGWLKSRHTFSFGEYHDPKFMGFGPLRVINEDRVAAGQGFNPHGHQDMEILTYVVDGALAHKDSMGNGSVIKPGDIQRMSAGTGVRHSEINDSAEDPVHFLQIWIVPEKGGIQPSYEQRTFPRSEKQGRLRLVGSRDAREASLTIHQDVDLYTALLADQQTVTHTLADGRNGWLQIVGGSITMDDQPLYPGDGVAMAGAQSIVLTGVSDAEVLLFDMGSLG